MRWQAIGTAFANVPPRSGDELCRIDGSVTRKPVRLFRGTVITRRESGRHAEAAADRRESSDAVEAGKSVNLFNVIKRLIGRQD